MIDLLVERWRKTQDNRIFDRIEADLLHRTNIVVKCNRPLHLDYAELLQEARITLWKSLLRWSPTTCSFQSWYIRELQFHMKQLSFVWRDRLLNHNLSIQSYTTTLSTKPGNDILFQVLLNEKLRESPAIDMTGVRMNRQKTRWVASIRTNGKEYHLGTFDTAKDASNAYQKAREEKLWQCVQTGGPIGKYT